MYLRKKRCFIKLLFILHSIRPLCCLIRQTTWTWALTAVSFQLELHSQPHQHDQGQSGNTTDHQEQHTSVWMRAQSQRQRHGQTLRTHGIKGRRYKFHQSFKKKKRNEMFLLFHFHSIIKCTILKPLVNESKCPNLHHWSKGILWLCEINREMSTYCLQWHRVAKIHKCHMGYSRSRCTVLHYVKALVWEQAPFCFGLSGFLPRPSSTQMSDSNWWGCGHMLEWRHRPPLRSIQCCWQKPESLIGRVNIQKHHL